MSARDATGINLGDPTEPTLADLFNIQVPEWYGRGYCAQTDPEAFFPDKGGSTREAKRICNGQAERGVEPCPVRERCLQYALDNDVRFGIWGGASERERRRIKAERGAA